MQHSRHLLTSFRRFRTVSDEMVAPLFEDRPRALLSGATGFIGRRLASHLLEQGWDVHVIVRPTSTITSLGDLPTVIHVDDGVAPLHSIVAASSPDVCFHMAGYFAGVHSDEDLAPLVIDNLLFGTRLADALATRGDSLLVNAGSYWQNAGGSDYHPVELYAAIKQAFQDILQFYVESARLQVVTVKFFETYGPKDRRPKLINLLMKAALTGTPIGISPGEQFVDLVHVDDAANACLAAANFVRTAHSSIQSIYAVTSGSPLQLRDLVDRIGEIIGKEVPVEWGKRGYRWREMMEPWDIAATVPGWVPAVSLDDGIRALWLSLSDPDTSGDVRE